MSGRFRMVLVVGLFTLQAVAVLAIILLTSAAMRPVLVKQMDQQMSASAQTAIGRTEAVLQTTADSAELTERALATDLVAVDDLEEVELFLQDELDANSQITGAFVGRPDGSFVIAQRGVSANEFEYRTKITEIADGTRTTTIHHYTDEGQEILPDQPDPNDTYDPRTRDWYRNAESTDGEIVVWTNPYVFFTSKKPGLTASLPVHDEYYDPSSQFQGVVGIDVELTQLSADLRENVDVTEHGTALVIDRDGGVITTRDPTNVIRPDGDAFRPVRLDELGDPAAQGAYEAAGATLASIPIGEQSIVTYTIGGEPYRAVFAPLEGHDRWYVLVAGAEHDYLGEIQRAQRFNALIAVAVGLAIVVIALPLLRFVADRTERLQQRANTDVLTGLANRRHFEEVLEKQIGRAHDRRRPMAVAMLDLDHFKAINDTFGHGVGDEALIAVANHLTSSVRDDDLVARLGGDEFAILLDGEDLDHAAVVLERARAIIEASPLTSGDQTVNVRITAGVADLIPGVRDNAALLRRADQALYVAKERGRNQVATIRDVDPAVAGITVPSDPAGHPTGLYGAPIHTPSAPEPVT